MHRVSIIGASGYSGMELTRILLAHRDIRVVAAGSDKLHARPIENPGTTTSGLTATASVSTYVTQAEAIAAECDVAFLATPAEASLELAPKLLAAGTRVIDLSGAFRLRDAAHYPRFYNFEHREPKLLAEAVYGLPELDRTRQRKRATRRESRLLCDRHPARARAAPGSWPRDRRRDVGRHGCGTQGDRGVQLRRDRDDVRAYRVAASISTRRRSSSSSARASTFVPHLLPVKRGILATCHVATRGKHVDFLARIATSRSSRSHRRPNDVGLRDVVGTNQCRIGWAQRRRSRRRHRRDRQPGQGRRRSGGAEPEPHARAARASRPRGSAELLPMKVPVGFRFAGAHAGLKPVRRDVALVVCDTPARRRLRSRRTLRAAAPVVDARPRVPAANIRAVVVNSGNANALTGPAGVEDVRRDSRGVGGGARHRAPTQVLTASTGVIGVRLPAQQGRRRRAAARRGAVAGAGAGRRGDHDDRHAHEARVAHARARRHARSRSSAIARARA